jgi:hypothetical protein
VEFDGEPMVALVIKADLSEKPGYRQSHAESPTAVEERR